MNIYDAVSGYSMTWYSNDGQSMVPIRIELASRFLTAIIPEVDVSLDPDAPCRFALRLADKLIEIHNEHLFERNKKEFGEG